MHYFNDLKSCYMHMLLHQYSYFILHNKLLVCRFSSEYSPLPMHPKIVPKLQDFVTNFGWLEFYCPSFEYALMKY